MARKICMLLDNAFHSDERVRKEINTLSCAGYEVTLVAMDGGKPPGVESIPHISVLRWIKTDLTRPFSTDYKQSIEKTAQRIAKLPFDALYVHDMYLASLALAVIQLKQDTVLFYDMHEYFEELDYSRELMGWTSRLKGRWVHKWLLKQERKLIKRSRLVTVTSAPICEAIADRYPDVNIAVLRNIPDWDQLERSEQERQKIRSSLSIPNDAPVLVHSGNIYMTEERAKDLVSRILETHPRLHILFINDRIQGNHLSSFVEKHGWGPRFHLCAFHSFDHLTILQVADAGWMHIDSELKSRLMTSPNRLYEYLLAGLPVLSSPQNEALHLKNKGCNSIHFYDLEDLQQLNLLIGNIKTLERPETNERETFKWSHASKDWLAQIRSALPN